MIDVDESTQKTILSLEDVDMEQHNDHYQNLDMNLIPCEHCRALRQEKDIPKCLMKLHIYVTHSVIEDKYSHEETLTKFGSACILDGYLPKLKSVSNPQRKIY